MGNTSEQRVRRVRSVGASAPASEKPAQQESGFVYKGFCAFGEETVDEFHDRMYNLPAVEAMMYEMEFAAGKIGL